MRASSVGWLYSTMEETLHVAKLTAEVTHNHPEGIKGAQAVASAIYLARTGADKDEIRKYVSETFSYDPDRTLAEIKPGYREEVISRLDIPLRRIVFEFEDYLSNR